MDYHVELFVLDHVGELGSGHACVEEDKVSSEHGGGEHPLQEQSTVATEQTDPALLPDSEVP